MITERTTPYFRIVCPPLYGGSATGNRIGEGTYWTPRWDAIVLMASTILSHLHTYKREWLDEDNGQVKIYKLDHAMMTNSPPEHSWAFTYGPDAGEQVLVKALKEPELVLECHAHSVELMELACTHIERCTDFFACERIGMWATFNDQKVYLNCNYQRKALEVAKLNPDGWSFVVIECLYDLKEMHAFLAKVVLPADFDPHCSLEFFVRDMNWDGLQPETVVKQQRKRRQRFTSV